MRLRAFAAWSLLSLVAGCGDGTSGMDASLAEDAGGADAAELVDAQPSDARAPMDATTPIDAAIDATAAPDARADAGACAPITSDPSAIGATCASAGDCPAGYTCQAFSGIVLQHHCEILCTRDCDCPQDHQCATVSDKSGSWTQCAPI